MLAMKLRTDLLVATTATSHMASTDTKRPVYVASVGRPVLAYVKGSADLRLTLKRTQENRGKILCYTDASFAHGARSLGAAVIALVGAPICGKAGRQSFMTMSAMEARDLTP